MRCRSRTITQLGAATMAFQVELALEGVVDRFNDLPQRFEEPAAGALGLPLQAGRSNVSPAPARAASNAAP